VTLGLGTGSIVPVLSGGGSIIRFAPDEGANSTQLSLDWGAGLKAVLGESLTGEVMVESSNYRLDRFRLAPGFDPADPGFPTDPNANDVLSNLTLRAGVGIQLGRRSMRGSSDLDDAFTERYQRPFSNFALAVEPLMGELDFDAATGLDSQRMLGARAGFDFGQFFGLRGFYWRGTESNFRNFGGMRAWGGEAQFALAAGPGLNPYLVAGAGQLEWDNDFSADPSLIPADQTSLILGGGVDFNFGPRIRATVAARDFVLAGSNIYARQELEGVSDPNQLVHNWQVSAGLKFVVGSGGIRTNRPVPAPAPPVALAPVAAAAPTSRPTAAPVAQGDTAQAVTMPAPGVSAEAPTTRAAPTAEAVSPRTVLFPVPERGEIYVRYGEAGGLPLPLRATPGDSVVAGATQTLVTEDALRRIVREEIAASRDSTWVGVAAPDQARLRAMERRIEQRLAELEARERAAREGGTVIVRDEAPGETVVVTDGPVSRSMRELRPYTGVAVSGQTQMLLGVAADIGPLRPGSSINLMPQLGLGWGQGPSTMLLSLGFEYRLPTLVDRSRFNLQPLLSLGPTLIKRNDYEAAVTLFVGAASRIHDSAGTQRAYLIYGFQGADLFDEGRILIGLRRMR
jgi:hypothetical protein